MARTAFDRRFLLERRLDEGGMSAVWLARDGETGGWAALKVARQHRRHGAIFQDALRQEADVLSRLSHPGIVRLLPLEDGLYAARAVSLAGNPWYCALEYLDGGSLALLIPRMMKFPLDWRLALLGQVSASLAWMHAQGYAHLDLKPEHILFREAPTPTVVPQPVLIDFGTAALLDMSAPSEATSPPYAAPELLRRQPDINAAPLDVWSLGVVGLELLAGVRPVTRWLRRPWLAQTDSARLARLCAVLPPVTARLLLDMLAPRPEFRPRMDEVAAALAR
jgi:serine/threonine-protein kinase